MIPRRINRRIYPAYPSVTSNPESILGSIRRRQTGDDDDVPDSACREMSRCFGVGGLSGVLCKSTPIRNLAVDRDQMVLTAKWRNERRRCGPVVVNEMAIIRGPFRVRSDVGMWLPEFAPLELPCTGCNDRELIIARRLLFNPPFE
jgi:hypothetical protein